MVTKNELRCKWVSQEIKCFDFMPGCKQVAIASLDEDCDKKLLVLNKSLPAIGHVNTKHTGLNLRSNPVYQDQGLRQSNIIVHMKIGADVQVVDIDDKLAKIAGMQGYWYKLTYTDDQHQTYQGYAFGPNIKLRS